MEVDWTGFAAASVAVVLAPGPGSLFVARTGAAGGARAGRAAMAGVMLGDLGLILLSLAGVSVLFRAHPALFHAVRLAGAGYLIAIGLQAMLHSPPDDAPPGRGNPARALRRGLAITLLNPKAVVFFMGFFPVFIRSGAGGLTTPYAGMTLVFMGISAAYLSLLGELSARAGAAFVGNRTLSGIARRLGGALFVGFGLKVAAATR